MLRGESMRFLLGVCCFLSLSVSALGQNTEPLRIATPEEVISRAIEFHAFEGNMEKLITRMGDAASVSVTRVLGDRNPSKYDIQIVLVILRSSFVDPNGVEIKADREPRTALFVLRYLERSTPDEGMKKEITDTRAYLQEQFVKYKAQAKSERTPL